ncbi:MAG TPA: L,D-transpeptidase family protein [Anaerolineae bacterium]|nr:L,D-transpeptidase family protein [Anaerolineae bacterium]
MNINAQPSPNHHTPRRSSCLFRLALIATGIFSLTFFLAALHALITSPYILPGTSTMGISLSGQTLAEASATLNNNWQHQTIRISHNDFITLTTPSALGLTLNISATLDQAYHHGRSLDSLHNFLNTPISPTISFNFNQAEQFLTTIAPHVAQPAQVGQIHIRNGQATSLPPQPGLDLNILATAQTIADNSNDILTTGQLPLIFTPTDAPAIPTPETITAINQWLNHSLTLDLYDPLNDESLSHTLTPLDWTAFATVTVTAHQVTWGIDNDKLMAEFELPEVGNGRYLSPNTILPQLAQALETHAPTLNARIYHHPTQHIVQPGETFSSIGHRYGIPYPWLQQANPYTTELFPGQTLTIPSPDDLLPLDPPRDKRIVVSIPDQRVRVYENDRLIWDWPASTGIPSSPTSPGIFQIQSFEETAYAGNWDLWMPNFMGVYQPVPTTDFMNGFHGFPTRNGRDLLWEANLGAPVTYGCILLDNTNIKTLYDWAPLGTIVVIDR